jgi:hypothetical protein
VTVIDSEGRPITPLTDRIKARLRPAGPGTTLLRGEALAASLLGANWTYFPSLCWRHDAIRGIGFRPGLDVVQDLGLLLDLCAAGGVMAVTDTVAFQYRRHADSDSSRRAVAGGRFVEERTFFATMATEFDDRGWPKAARSARMRLVSRLHAATLTPRALRAGEWGVLAQLARHAGGR